jgi:hypothetical protein
VRGHRLHFLFPAILAFATSAFANATITIHDIDAPNAGLNDPTPAAPLGGNSGTTLGQQRMIALQAAANIWGSLIDSSVEIVIDAKMTSLSCDATGVVLADCGPQKVVDNFPNAPKQDVWYPIALANKFAATDLDPGNPDIAAEFNSDLGNGTCFGSTGWYYGLDGNHGDAVDMVTVALHEFAHGLGISGSYDSQTGALFEGKPNVFELHTLDDTTGKRWDQMTDAERLASQKNDQNLVWDGEHARLGASAFLGPAPFLRVLGNSYRVGTASFGPTIGVAQLIAPLVAPQDPSDSAGPSATDGCSPFTDPAGVIGRIAIVDRGTCQFVVKARNAQDAGAAALIIADNVSATSPLALGGDDGSIAIPVISVTKSDGAAIRAQAAAGASALLAADPQQLAGADSHGFVKLFAPSPLQDGSSIHHWDSSATPDLLMEPSISSRLSHGVDITADQLSDLGWDESPSGRRTLQRK